MSFSPEGKLIVTASDNEKAANVWSARKGELVAKLKNATYPVVFSLNGRTLATGSRDKAVLLWDVPN
jgi:WD40 repeat protein